MNLNELLGRLNNEQREAALDIHGSSMVVAGPGSGKTFTLVTRTANMIANGIPADSIMLFTFTNKAAKEIRDRVIGTIGDEAKRITVGTYHSVCSRLLRTYGKYLGYTKTYSILDTDDCKKIMKDIIKTSGFDYEADKMLWKVSNFKSRLIAPIDALRNAQNTMEGQIAQIYQLYENKLLENNGMDFDNLIYKTVRLLQQYPLVKQEINNKYRYIVAKTLAHIAVMQCAYRLNCWKPLMTDELQRN